MNPSRLNPRVGAAKKGENSSDLESSYAELFEENGEANKASLLSLINDTINRTPMGLIQVIYNSLECRVVNKPRIIASYYSYVL